MSQDILPPKTKTVLSTAEVDRVISALREVYENTMVDTATGRYLSRLGTDRGVPRPPVFFADDNRWRAIVKELAFNVRHTRDAVRRVMELILAPQVSQVTVLDRDNNRGISVGNVLNIAVGVNAGTYTVAGVVANELIFPAGTFAVVPDVGLITYTVGLGPVPIVGPTTGTHGRIYLHADGTERFRDTFQTFINIQHIDFLSTLNTSFPQFCTIVFDKESPVEETRICNYYDNTDSGLGKLSTPSLNFTHEKYTPHSGGKVLADVEANAFTLALEPGDGARFPVNAGDVQLVQVADNLVILEGVNAGTHVINAVNGNRVTVVGVLAVTGPAANNRFKITPTAVPVASKGTVFNRGGIVSTGGGNSVFACSKFLFDQVVDVDKFAVRINRGEVNEEIVEVASRSLDTLSFTVDPADASKSLLRYAHKASESVEVLGLPTTANGTHFPIIAASTTSTITGTIGTTIDDAAASFPASLIGSDIEFLTGTVAGRLRTIATVPLVTRLTFALFENPLAVPLIGGTYRIIKRYKAGTDNILYVDDASGLPLSNFTVILDRGKPNEEVVFIATNASPATADQPWQLTLSNPVTVQQDHEMDMTVEAAQLLVEGCDWEIIETRATGEFTILVDPACLPDMGPDGLYLHPLIPSLAASVNAEIIAAPTAIGDDFIQMALTGVNSYETLEQADAPTGYVFRPVVIDAHVPNLEEFTFLTRQRRFTKLVSSYYPPAVPTQDFLEVADATSFKIGGLPLGAVVSRVSDHPAAVSESITIDSADITVNPHRLNLAAALVQVHEFGDSVEVSPNVEVLTHDPIKLIHPVGSEVSYLYIEEDPPLTPKYKHIDSFDSTVFTNIVNGTTRNPPPNESYLADSGQVSSDQTGPFPAPQAEGKPIYPGSYIFGLIDYLQTTINQITSNVTTLHSTYDPLDTDAMFRIPYQTKLVENDTEFVTTTITALDIVPPKTWFSVVDASQFPATGFLRLSTGLVTEEVVEYSSIVGGTTINLTYEFFHAHLIGATVEGPLDIGVLQSSGALFIENGSLYPVSAQNPFYIVLDRGTSIEERLECAGIIGSPVNKTLVSSKDRRVRFPNRAQIAIDPTQNPQFDHLVGGTVDLEISKLRIQNPFGLADQGGIYFDYGFRGNSVRLEDVQITSFFTAAAPPPLPWPGDYGVLEDSAQTFLSYYASPGDLYGSTILIRGGTPTQEIVTALNILSDIQLLFEPALTVPLAPGDAYTIFATVEVDDEEFNTAVQGVGGIITEVGVPGAIGTKHPPREGGVVEEYVRYSSKSGNIITLATPTIFKNGHPSNTQLVIASNQYKTSGDGSDYPPYLAGGYLDVIFNSDVSNFESLIRPAGIEVKIEVEDA